MRACRPENAHAVLQASFARVHGAVPRDGARGPLHFLLSAMTWLTNIRQRLSERGTHRFVVDKLETGRVAEIFYIKKVLDEEGNAELWGLVQ
ncbi:MAG: hypothetical protein ACOCVM_09690 [Desulfovibrionaceae bacterium]